MLSAYSHKTPKPMIGALVSPFEALISSFIRQHAKTKRCGIDCLRDPGRISVAASPHGVTRELCGRRGQWRLLDQDLSFPK